MIVDQNIRRRFELSLPYARDLETRVRTTLGQFAASHECVVDSRLKSLESLSEKIESGRYASWDHIDDLVAATVAVPSISAEGAVLDFLREAFLELGTRSRGSAQKDPDVFRFDATRFYGRLRPPTGMPPAELVPTFALTFEVQVPTLFELAWSRTTHSVAYKTGRVDWRRKRLAAQLKAAVEQLDMLVLNFDVATNQVGAGGWTAVLNDQLEIQGMFLDLVASGAIPSESVPKDWSRFAENVYTVIKAFAGRRTYGREWRRLDILPRALEIVRTYVQANSGARFPKSVSLFQVVVGAIASAGEFRGTAVDYYVTDTPEFRTLFPGVAVPGPRFELGVTEAS